MVGASRAISPIRGVAPTNLLAARPELGRDEETPGRRLIRALSERGILLGTVETAKLPALYATTSPDAERGGFNGPRGLGHMSGPPGEQKLYSRLRSAEEAQRIWQVSEELTKVPIPNIEALDASSVVAAFLSAGTARLRCV